MAAFSLPKRLLATAAVSLLLAAAGCRDEGPLREVEAKLTVGPGALAFGEVPVGRTRSLEFTLRTVGASDAALVWRTSAAAFLLEEAPGALHAGSARARVSWTPQEEGAASGWLEVALAGPAEPTWLRVSLSGVALPASACAARTPCEGVQWNGASGVCERSGLPDGTRCATTCLPEGVCFAGGCRGTPLTCDDANPCTEDVCVEGRGCTHLDVVCPSPSPCQVGVCDAQQGCSSAPAADGTSCGPLQTCDAAEVCLSGVCQTVDLPDGAACRPTSAHPCVGGTCEGSTCHPKLLQRTSAGAVCPPLWPGCEGGAFFSQPGALAARPGRPFLGDVNGDGFLDVVLEPDGSGSLDVLLGLGNGRWTSEVPQEPAFGAGRIIALEDVDRDGRAEVLRLNDFSSAPVLQVLGGSDEGRLQVLQVLSLPTRPLTWALADVDADGRLDLALSGAETSTVQLLHGEVGGTFARWLPVALGEMLAWGLALGDADGDGHVDLAVSTVASDGTGEVLHLLLGNGAGSFTASASYVPRRHGGIRALTLADLDGNGRAELVMAIPGGDWGTGTVEVAELGEEGQLAFRLSAEVGVPRLAKLKADAAGREAVLMLDSGTGRVLRGLDAPQEGSILDDFALGGENSGAAVGDVDGDGLEDVVAVAGPSGTLTFLRNLGDARFGNGWASTPSESIGDGVIGAGDLDGDGDVDLAVCAAGRRLEVYRNEGGRTFRRLSIEATNCGTAQATLIPLSNGVRLVALAHSRRLRLMRLQGDALTELASLPLSGTPQVLTSVDLNGDGALELLMLDASSGAVQTWFQSALSLFAAGPSTEFGPLDSLLASDLNGDGRADLLMTRSGQEQAEVHLGQGDGTFSGPLSFPAPPRFDSATSLDVTQDGTVDLLLSSWRDPPGDLAVWRGEGGGRFSSLLTYALHPTEEVAQATRMELDGDGAPELLVRYRSGQVGVARGLSDGGVGPQELGWVYPYPMVWADLDGDGRVDLAGSGLVERGLTVHWNHCGP